MNIIQDGHQKVSSSKDANLQELDDWTHSNNVHNKWSAYYEENIPNLRQFMIMHFKYLRQITERMDKIHLCLYISSCIELDYEHEILKRTS